MNIAERILIFMVISIFLCITAIAIVAGTPLILPVLLTKYVVDQING